MIQPINNVQQQLILQILNVILISHPNQLVYKYLYKDNIVYGIKLIQYVNYKHFQSLMNVHNTKMLINCFV